MIFDEFLRFSMKISTLNYFFRVKKGNIGDLPNFDFFRLASLFYNHFSLMSDRVLKLQHKFENVTFCGQFIKEFKVNLLQLAQC